MAGPELYEIFDREAKALAEHLRPRRVFLNMDEIRMGGTCKACAGKDMAQLLGQCITRQSDEGFNVLVACYYDADNLNDVKAWLTAAKTVPKVQGFMYTPWQKKYQLLPPFGDLIGQER